MRTDPEFPGEARNEHGVLWWEAPIGLERRLAAWLFFNKALGEEFSLPELRAAVGGDAAGTPNTDEHVNRRLRQLRKDGWEIPSHIEDRSLRQGSYRLTKKGWYDGFGPRPTKVGFVSQRTRLEVMTRDGSRCVVCGVASGEPYPDPPHGPAVMTIGHRIPQNRGGSGKSDNLRCECQRCNQPARDEMANPDTFDEVYARVKSLPRAEKQTLLGWLRNQARSRSALDELYDRARNLNEADRARLVDELEQTFKGR